MIANYKQRFRSYFMAQHFIWRNEKAQRLAFKFLRRSRLHENGKNRSF